MTCLFQPRCNHIWSVWYCIFVVALHAYLVYLGIHRYQLYEDIPWRFGGKPQIFLYLYIGIQGAVIVCLPFFIGCSMFKTGNIASDNEALGLRSERIVEIRGRSFGSKRCKSIWQHGPPAGQTIHLMMAFALLIAEQLMIAQFYNDYRDDHAYAPRNVRKQLNKIGHAIAMLFQVLYNMKGVFRRMPFGIVILRVRLWHVCGTSYAFVYGTFCAAFSYPFRLFGLRHARHRDMDNDLLWSTDLDFIYKSGSRLSHVMPRNSSIYGSWSREDFKKYLTSHQDPKVLPIVASQKLFGINLEFLNYFLALTIFAVIYPSVFWRASKWFSFLFSLHLMLHAFVAIFAYVSFSLLYRLQTIKAEPYMQALGTTKKSFLLPNAYCVLGCYLLSLVTMFLASVVLYSYGYTRYCLCWLLQSQKRNQQTATGVVRSENSINTKHQIEAGFGCCEGYCPHMMAILLLIVMVASKIFPLYDMTMVYLNHKDHEPLALSCIVLEVTYLFAWIFLWLFLTCKRRWGFKVGYGINDLICLLHADRPGPHALPGQRSIAQSITDPDNAMLLMTNEELYITDDTTKKAAILRQAHKYGLGSPKDEVYWLKPNGPGSPAIGAEKQRQVVTASNKTSPEMNKLLTGKPELENEYSFASTPTTDRQPGPFYKVSFDDGQQVQMAGNPPVGLRQQQMIRHPQTSGRAGSYLRFGEIEGSNISQYENHEQDVVAAFGTMPRGEYKRRRMLQGSDADFQYPQYGGQQSMVGSRHGSETGSVTYAAVHKTHPSPVPSNGYQTRDYVRLVQRPVVGGSETEANVSRGSSYANIPSYSTRQHPMRQGSWDSGSATRLPPAPPQARVTPSTNFQLRQKYPSPAPENMGSQQGTPLSPRTQARYVQQQQQQYASLNGGTSYNEPAGMSATYQSFGGSQNTNPTRVRQSPPVERAPNTAFAQPTDPYSQRTGKKMSSFSDISKAGQPDPLAAVLGATITNNGPGRVDNSSREATPISNESSTLTRYGQQQQQVHWHTNPMYGQEPLGDNVTYTTPSSTLTSQGSYTLTPTPSSPPSSTVSSTNQSNAGMPNGNGNAGGGGILTRKASGGSYVNGAQVISNRPPVSTGKILNYNSVANNGSRGHNRNDSANYSLTSSNESGEPVQNGQFTASIV